MQLLTDSRRCCEQPSTVSFRHGKKNVFSPTYRESTISKLKQSAKHFQTKHGKVNDASILISIWWAGGRLCCSRRMNQVCIQSHNTTVTATASAYQAPCHALVGDSRLMHPVTRHLRNEDVVPGQWPCCAAQQYLGFAICFFCNKLFCLGLISDSSVVLFETWSN